MVSTFTPNVQFEEPARGDYVGTWDTPVNANMTALDLMIGGRTTISGAAGSVVLAAAQFQCKTITFNSTLLASITVTFPTSFTKSYEIQNLCTGSSAFVITLQTTAAGGQAICCPPGEVIECLNDGTNIKFKNLGRVGEYWDYAGSSIPNWVSGCTVPPYQLCNGGANSSATYPALFNMIGGTLPDASNRVRAAISMGVTRLTTGVTGGGFNGATLFAAGGDQALQGHTHANTLTDPGHVHNVLNIGSFVTAVTPGGANAVNFTSNQNTQSAVTNITINNVAAGTGGSANVQPTYIGGITMIRSA